MKTYRLVGGYREARRNMVYVPARHWEGLQKRWVMWRYEVQPISPAASQLDELLCRYEGHPVVHCVSCQPC